MQEEICGLPYFDKAKMERYITYREEHSGLEWEDIITHVNIGLDTPFYSNPRTISDPSSTTVLVNKYRRLDSDYVPSDLEQIDQRYNPEGLLLRRKARIAFEIMCDTAKRDGIHLEAVSTFRSFSYQSRVYHKNLTPDMSLEEYHAIRDKVSARAGHSEHQTGFAVDINELEESFEATPTGIWLNMNSWRFGFLLRYPKGKENITGYAYEPWHFRYLGIDLAVKVHLSNLTYDEYYVRYL